ncbi:hypothetical protein L3Y34_012250 [Caenorhabditis briggsae]|uniref:Glycoside hydrolase 35 catalytic domain-containing protein n=1 Tax=Caenorhabditis briggsae TaxID=6238 RepID=A0AAE8ZS00_CAEBR|nr:hypothetical protein L3Y34_012250 [Caenorhabditis briggsae]
MTRMSSTLASISINLAVTQQQQQAIFSNFLLFLLSLSLYRAETATSFEIDKVNHQFLLDVNPFIYLAREIHYFQIPTDKSEDRLKRVRALGFTVPVPWNLHQLNRNSIADFSGNLDFIKTPSSKIQKSKCTEAVIPRS